jgi:hypothetical protein
MRATRPAIVATATKKNVKCFIKVPPFGPHSTIDLAGLTGPGIDS